MNGFLEAVGTGIAISLIFAVILGFIAFMRYLSYRETIELAERGMLHPRHQRRQNSKLTRGMRIGIVVSAIGMALTCGLFTIGFEEDYLLGPWLLGGFIPLAIGGALLTIGWMNQKSASPADPVIHIDDDPIPPHKMNP